MRFAPVDLWGGTWDSDVTGVAVDAQDRVYVLQGGGRGVTVLDAGGAVLDRWGAEVFSPRPHMIAIAGERAFVTDDGGHAVLVFTLGGALLERIGSGVPACTGFDADAGPEAFSRMPGGGPFNRPTKAVAAPDGTVFVSDGYRNCRIHRFSADRQEVRSWGGPGADDGHFVIPHSVTLDSSFRILVCDRENDRIQVFSADGALLEAWTDVQRPTDLAFDRHGYAYVTELSRGPGDLKSWRLGPAKEALPARLTVWSPDRTIAARLCDPAFRAPHAVAVDSAGAIYVAEVPESFARYTGQPHRRGRCLHKFARAVWRSSRTAQRGGQQRWDGSHDGRWR